MPRFAAVTIAAVLTAATALSGVPAAADPSAEGLVVKMSSHSVTETLGPSLQDIGRERFDHFHTDRPRGER